MSTDTGPHHDPHPARAHTNTFPVGMLGTSLFNIALYFANKCFYCIAFLLGIAKMYADFLFFARARDPLLGSEDDCIG